MIYFSHLCLFYFFICVFSLRSGQNDSDNEPDEMSSICEEDIAQSERDHLDNKIGRAHV